MFTANKQLSLVQPYRNLNLSEQTFGAYAADKRAFEDALGVRARVSARQKRGKYVLIGAWSLVIVLVVCAMAVVGIVLEDEYIDLFQWVAASCGGLCLVTAVALMAGNPAAE